MGPPHILKAESEAATPLKIFPGDKRLLIVAPHGRIKRRMNDKKTAEIAFRIQELLNCFAIVNDSIRKKTLDYNLREEAETDPAFIKALKNAVNNDGMTMVVWIHGAHDDSVKQEAKVSKDRFEGKPEDLHALIGYGQGANPKNRIKSRRGTEEDNSSRFTATKETAEKIRDLLTQHGITTILTRDKASNYRGRDPDNMNQYFLDKKYPLERVQSVQIEIREKGFREKEHVEKTARILADVFSSLLGIPKQDALPLAGPIAPVLPSDNAAIDEAVVERAYNVLAGIVRKHLSVAMLEAGNYLLREFYNDDIELALSTNAAKHGPLRQLIRKMQSSSGDTPSKTWVYNALKLAIDHRRLADVSVYGKLGLSHQVYLTHENDVDTKKALIHEAVKNNYTVAQLKKRMKAVKPDKSGLISPNRVPEKDQLMKKPLSVLKKTVETIESEIEKLQRLLQKHHEIRDLLISVIEEKESSGKTETDAEIIKVEF